LNSLVYVAPSRIHGQGLFAVRPLKAGQLIGVYRGSVTDQNGDHVLWVENDGGGGWTGYDGKNELRFMNHADSPTAEMDGLNCYALVDMDAKTEITIDYGWNDS
jgi:SET domain-containing protein